MTETIELDMDSFPAVLAAARPLSPHIPTLQLSRIPGRCGGAGSPINRLEIRRRVARPSAAGRERGPIPSCSPWSIRRARTDADGRH